MGVVPAGKIGNCNCGMSQSYAATARSASGIRGQFNFHVAPETTGTRSGVLLLAAVETGHYPAGVPALRVRQGGGRRKPDGPARGRTGGELARAELWTRPTKRVR